MTLIERETLDSGRWDERAQRARAARLAAASGEGNLAAAAFEPPNNVATTEFAATAPLRKDEARLIAAAKQGRQQLEELFARDAAELPDEDGAPVRPEPERVTAGSRDDRRSGD